MRCQCCHPVEEESLRHPRIAIVLGLLLVAVLFATLLSVSASGKRSSTDKQKSAARQSLNYVRPTDPSLYLGSDTCKTCHEDKFKSIDDSRHFAAMLDSKGPEWHGCEACHGPGKAHVDGGGDKTKIFLFSGASEADASARCLACHAFSEEQSGFLRSEHAASYLQGLSYYSSRSNYGSGSLFVRPIPRMTAWIGYSVTSAVGYTFTINPLSPTGPLTYRYYLPLAALNFNLTKAFAFKSSWNFYDYHEYSDAGPTLPRGFRGNVFTFSLRYAF